MFYYPHHIGDYRSATAHLSNEEDLAYRRLLDMYYDTEQPIPLDTQWVARRIRIAPEVVAAVLADFFTQTDDGWRSARCDREIAEYKAKAEIARANGKKGGRRKTKQQPSGNPAGSDQVADGNPALAGSKANQEPITKNHGVPDGTQAPAALGVQELVADGLSEDTAVEWLAHRKRIKAPMTPRAWTGIKNQATLAGISVEDAVSMSLRNGWRGFEASYARGRAAPAPASSHSGFESRSYANEDF